MSDATNTPGCGVTLELTDGVNTMALCRIELPLQCEWPGCTNPALCQSGNLDGLLVCVSHFRMSNGENAIILMPDTGKEN